MNRITNALAAAIPSSSSASDASSTIAGGPNTASPDPSAYPPHRPSSASGDGPGQSGWANTGPSGSTSGGGLGAYINISTGLERANFHSLIYDDPRQTHFYTGQDRLVLPPGLGFGRDRSGSRRPPHLRHVSDNPATAMAGSGSRSGSATPSRMREDKDRTVRADLGGKKGQNRLGGMVKGTDGRYAVGGPQCLKILHISAPSSGTATPPGSTPNRGRTTGALLARGPGGVRVLEVANLWKSSWSISKGVNDLDWGSGAYNNKLVTATPSGGFLIFDVNKGRLDREIHGGSPRPLNRVHLCPHPTYGYLLLTGSAEGQAKLWDLRENNPHQKKYYKHSTAVTALAFSPDDPSSLVVGTENGTLKRYDLRMAPKPVGTLWGAHGNKAVMDLKWKGALAGDESGFMASAGADKIVQVWDMSQQWDRNPTPLHTLYTSLPPRRVAWRPDHPTELAVVPLQQALSGDGDAETESTVEVWDVRRHHIAKYALPAGKTGDSGPVDAVWGEDSMGIVTAFSSGSVAQLDMRSRTLPLEGLPRQTVAWSMRDEVAYTVDRFKSGEIPFDDLKPEYANHWDKVGRRPKGIADSPYRPLQAVGIVPMPEVNEADFRHLAQQYKLEGGTAVALCLYNQAVAAYIDRVDDVRLWAFLGRLLFELGPAVEDGETGSATFDEDIFSHPLKQAPRVPTPPSPSGSPRGGSTQLPTPNESRAMSPSTSKERRYVTAGIALDRVGDHNDTDQMEELASAATSPSPIRGTTSFASFRPIDNNDRRLSDVRASIATIRPGGSRSRESTSTIIAPRFSRHLSGGRGKPFPRSDTITETFKAGMDSAPQSANRSLSTSPVQIAGNDLRRASLASSPTRSRTGSHSRERHGSHGEFTAPAASQSYRDRKISDRSGSGRSTHSAMHDYPDPYGFIPSLGAVTGSSSKTATETSASSRNPTRDPSPAPAKMHAGSLGASIGRSVPSAIATATAAAMAPGGSMRMSSTTTTAATSAKDTQNSSRAGSGDKSKLGSNEMSTSPSVTQGAEPGSAKRPGGLYTSTGQLNNGTVASRSSNPTSRTSGPTTTARTSSDARTSIATREPRSSKHGDHGWMSAKAWKEYRSARCAVFMEWWHGLIEEGNVQLAVTLMVVASNIIDFPRKQSQRLAHAYIDQLDRYRLPGQSAYLRKYAAVQSLQITSTQMGVTHVVHCQTCGKSTGSLEEIGMEKEGKKFWYCVKCRVGAKACAICRKAVHGLNSACPKCKHGGHPACMLGYFSSQATTELNKVMLQAPLAAAGLSSLHPLHRTSSAQPAGGNLGGSSSGVIRENSLAELSSDESGFAGAGTGSAQRSTLTPGHSAFAQLPGAGAVTAPAPMSSSHDSSNFVAPHPGQRRGHTAQSADMQVINSGHATDQYSHSSAHPRIGCGDADGNDSGLAGDVPMEWVPVRLSSKCPQGCGCVCRVVSQMERVPISG